jgi:hypothetical protein
MWVIYIDCNSIICDAPAQNKLMAHASSEDAVWSGVYTARNSLTRAFLMHLDNSLDPFQTI